MIKKLFIVLISSLCVVFSANANIKISPEAVGDTIREFFKAEKDAASALATYNAAVGSDGSISANAIWNVCSAGGLDIKKSADKTKCQNFKSKLIKSATVKMYAVCDDYKGKTGGKEYCVHDFKNIQVNVTPAIKIAQEYARVKNKDTIQCSSKRRKSGFQDYVKCTSQNDNIYYEFEFDDIKESFDDTIKFGILNAICGLYGATAVATLYCESDEQTCSKINVSMDKFGYAAKYNNKKCEVDFNTITKKEDLHTAYGIDNFTFCRGIQMQNSPTVEDGLKAYIIEFAKKNGTNLNASQIRCDAGFRTYKGKGCKVNGITDYKDDIKTCYVGKEQIDFVFDDINEFNNKRHKGGQQAMDCIISGGNYRGKSCIVAGEETCKKVIAANSRRCPECSKVYWDKDLKQCMLPASAAVESMDKGLQVGIIVGTTAAAVAVTVATGGTAGAGAALLVVEVVGATIETAETIKIQQIADEFFNESVSCNEPTCAENLIKKYLQRLSNVYNDLTDAEAPGIDQEMARLFEIIPETSDVYNGTRLQDNQKSMFDSGSWEPEQVWRAVGVGLQFAGLITGFVKWLARTPKMAKTTAVITTKLQKALPAAKEMKALAAHTDDVTKVLVEGSDDALKILSEGSDDAVRALGASTMKRADAKALQDIAERAAKGPLSKTDIYKREQIYNIYKGAYGSAENIEMAGRSVMKSEQIADVEAKLAKAQQELKYAQEHTSQISRVERNARQAKVESLTKELLDLGVTYNKVDNVTDATRNVTRTVTETADDAARNTGKVADKAVDAGRVAGNTTRNINELDELYQIGYNATKRDEILKKWGLPLDATEDQISKRFRELGKHFHYDNYVATDPAFADEVSKIFAEISHERELLKTLPRVSDDVAAGALKAGTGSGKAITSGVESGARTGMKALPSAEKTVATAAKEVPMIGHDLIGVAAGARALGRLIPSENPGPLDLTRVGDEEPGPAPVVIIPGGDERENGDGDGNNDGGDGSVVPDNHDPENNDGNNGTPEGNSNGGSNPVIVPLPNQNQASGNNRPTTFTPDKTKNTGLIVGLTAAGLVATGAIVGGVVAATTKNKTSGTSAAVANVVDEEMEKALRNADSIIGTVNGKQVSLIPLPTTVNTKAKLVDIDGFAVAVVGYDGHNLPYFIKNSKWTPLLGIGEEGRWFNVYSKAKTGIKTIDTITDLMNQQINPAVVSRYLGINASGLSLPTASPKAFEIINAEFPNGVVQNEKMDVAAMKLYSDNYDLMKSKLK